MRQFAKHSAELLAQGFEIQFFVVEGVALAIAQVENGRDTFTVCDELYIGGGVAFEVVPDSLQELAAFPSGSKDDQVDALSRAFSMVGSVAPMRIDPRAVAMARGRR